MKVLLTYILYLVLTFYPPWELTRYILLYERYYILDHVLIIELAVIWIGYLTAAILFTRALKGER